MAGENQLKDPSKSSPGQDPRAPTPHVSNAKATPASSTEKVSLKKEIGLVSACAIIIGNIIGSGIFISPKGVLEHTGSVGLALIIWVLVGGVSALGSMCYAELGVAIPKSGGDYSYVTEIFGGLAGFLLLWSAVLIMYPTSLAVIALTFSNYVLQPVFPDCVPPYNASRVLSIVCLLLLTWVNSSSVRWATRIQDIFTAGKLLALCLIIIVGFTQIFKGHYEELIPSNAFNFWMTPTVGQLALAFLQGSFAFSGWNFLNYVTEELVDPRRLCFSGAREGHLPSLLAMIHFKYCTPVPALLVCCGATIVIMLVGDTYTLINYVSFINYLCYGVTIMGLIVLRWKKPKMFRPIKVNLIVPITYLIFWAFLLIFSFYSEPVVCGVGLIIILTGVPVFFLAVYWRKKPKCIDRFIESMTYCGQKVCYVVYPQPDLPEEEDLTPYNDAQVADNEKTLKMQ
ncbi:asc-type amino acid transporter 1 isoform X2 [Ascaphus truei]|uniref:asc-type amino acid transporter 1 isoform X2 n=1 Tax=Ascaphus truei TaxID=8439 RepID=UPI003F5A95CE